MNLMKVIADLQKNANEFLIAKQNYDGRKGELDAQQKDIENKLLKYKDFEKREAEVNARFAKIQAQDDFQKANEKFTEEKNAFAFQRDKDLKQIEADKKKNADDAAANKDRAETLAKGEQELNKNRSEYKAKIEQEVVRRITGLEPAAFNAAHPAPAADGGK